MIPARTGAAGAARLELLEAGSPRVEEIWRDLERRAAPPYFLSWGWMSNWLACLPRADAPRLGVLLGPDGPSAAFFLGQRRIVRHRVLHSRALFLNATGCEPLDELTLEHNALLCAPDAALSLGALLAALPADWDELVLPGLSRAAFPGNALGGPLPGYVVRVERESPSPYVDLAKVRAAPDGYLGLLHAGTRAKVRRAQRGFGALSVDVAAGVDEALDIYGELVDLHTRSWRSRGLPGAFADPWFHGFHRRLIVERFAHGEIQLLRVRGQETVGCLYNLISAGRVLFYQSGLARFDDPRLRPGYVCHAEAVRHNAAAGHAVYDLLGGGTHYKRSLATDEVGLVWARIQRPHLRFALEEQLRRGKRALERLRSKAMSGDSRDE